MALRRRAAGKVADADRLWFTREGLEQATSEPLARHRAARLAADATVADLCCGLGLDLLALADGRPGALAVDRDPLHLRCATLNAAARGLDVRAEQADVREVAARGLLDDRDVVFVDPARRSGGRRLDPLATEPPLDWCVALAERGPAVVVKAAPGLPRTAVPPGWELTAVSVQREMRETVLWSPGLAQVPRRAVLHARDGTSVHELLPVPGEAPPLRDVDAVVLDPDPAVTRSGLVQDLARHLGAAQVDPQTAVLTLAEPVITPFARVLRVEATLPWSLKALRAELTRLDVGAVDLRRRGLAGDVDEIRRRLRLRGSRRVTVLLTRVRDEPWVIVGTAAPHRGADE